MSIMSKLKMFENGSCYLRGGFLTKNKEVTVYTDSETGETVYLTVNGLLITQADLLEISGENRVVSFKIGNDLFLLIEDGRMILLSEKEENMIIDKKIKEGKIISFIIRTRAKTK